MSTNKQHTLWKAAHFLPCTLPPDVLRLHRPQRGRTHYGPSQRRAFVVTRSGFQTMPSGGLGDDEDTAAGASFGTVCHPSPLTKSADLQTALAPPDADAFGTKIYENVGLNDFTPAPVTRVGDLLGLPKGLPFKVSLLWYVPPSRYIWSSAPILFLQEQIKTSSS